MSSVVHPVVSPAGIRILQALIGRSAKTVSDLIAELQVTRTAVITPLNELISMGFIEQRLEHNNTPGRPKFRYTATDKAVSSVYGGLQQHLVPAFLKRAKEHTDKRTFQKICANVASDIVSSFTSQTVSKHPKERLEQFVKKWKEAGRLIEFEEHKNCYEVWKFACPFVTMVDDERIICDVDITKMKLVAADDNMERAQSRNDGYPCCVFRLAKK